MWTINYKELYGDIEKKSWEKSELDEFVFLAPHLGFILSVLKVIPPRIVLNDFFQREESNAGMGGAIVWKRFSINQEEYDKLVTILCNDSKKQLSKDVVFENEVSFEVWHEKIMQKYQDDFK